MPEGMISFGSPTNLFPADSHLLCMQRQIILAICSIFLVEFTYASPWDFPDIDAVIREFYANYRLAPEPGLELHFARKSDGWYLITIRNRQWSPPESEEIFWSAETGTFLPVDYEKLPVDAQPNVEYHLRAYFEQGMWKRQQYASCRYMGYAAWMDDMIRDLGGQSDLDLVDREGLARAHDMKTDRHLHGNYGLSSSDPMGYEFLPDGPRLDSILFHFRSAISLYQKIEEQDPGYETFIGPIGLKLANEYLTAWHALLSIQRADLAAEFLPDSIYSPYIRNFARLVLESCPKDALLMVNGDNDYFPMMYLQASLGIRQDVKVVNQSLLSTVWYQQMINDTIHRGSAPVGFLPDDDLLKKMRKGYVWTHEYGKDPEVRLPVGRHQWSIPVQGSGQNTYIMANQLWLGEWFRFQAMRPTPDSFCAASTLDPRMIPGLHSHLENRGLIYVMVDDEFEESSSDPLAYHQGKFSFGAHKALVNNMLQTRLWPRAAGADESYPRRLALMVVASGYLYHYLRLQQGDNPLDQLQVDIEAWSGHVKPLLQEGEDPTDSYYMAQLAILGYASGLETLGAAWEGCIYVFLDALLEDPESPWSAEELSRSLTGLRYLGYFFQESGRESQYLALTQTIAAYEEDMRNR